jgi:hypothetical protein
MAAFSGSVPSFSATRIITMVKFEHGMTGEVFDLLKEERNYIQRSSRTWLML